MNIAQGEPIIAHYRAKGLVHDIEGNQDINDVFSDIEKVLTNLNKAFFTLAKIRYKCYTEIV